jgi:hypothetical protein
MWATIGFTVGTEGMHPLPLVSARKTDSPSPLPLHVGRCKLGLPLQASPADDAQRIKGEMNWIPLAMRADDGNVVVLGVDTSGVITPVGPREYDKER